MFVQRYAFFSEPPHSSRLFFRPPPRRPVPASFHRPVSSVCSFRFPSVFLPFSFRFPSVLFLPFVPSYPPPFPFESSLPFRSFLSHFLSALYLFFPLLFSLFFRSLFPHRSNPLSPSGPFHRPAPAAGGGPALPPAPRFPAKLPSPVWPITDFLLSLQEFPRKGPSMNEVKNRKED